MKFPIWDGVPSDAGYYHLTPPRCDMEASDDAVEEDWEMRTINLKTKSDWDYYDARQQ